MKGYLRDDLLRALGRICPAELASFPPPESFVFKPYRSTPEKSETEFPELRVGVEENRSLYALISGLHTAKPRVSYRQYRNDGNLGLVPHEETLPEKDMLCPPFAYFNLARDGHRVNTMTSMIMFLYVWCDYTKYFCDRDDTFYLHHLIRALKKLPMDRPNSGKTRVAIDVLPDPEATFTETRNIRVPFNTMLSIGRLRTVKLISTQEMSENEPAPLTFKERAKAGEVDEAKRAQRFAQLEHLRQVKAETDSQQINDPPEFL